MVRMFVWLAGICVLVYAMNHFGLWREMAALLIVGTAVLWVLGGAFILSRGGVRGAATGGATAAKRPNFRESVEAAEKDRVHREGAK